jgi:HNH endonuclease
MSESDSNLVVISRKEAKAKGLKFYFTGKACKRGHVSKRYVSANRCWHCAEEQRKQWRATNPEWTRQLRRNWRRNNPEKERASHIKSNRKWWAVAKDRVNKKRNEIYAQNPEVARQRQRAYIKKAYAERTEVFRLRGEKWRRENPELAREIRRRSLEKWEKANPDGPRVKAQNRRNRKRQNGKHTIADIVSIKKLQSEKCAYCKSPLGKNYHIDHIVPLAKGGGNDRRNLQLLCGFCNMSKGARDPIYHARTLGLLL